MAKEGTPMVFNIDRTLFVNDTLCAFDDTLLEHDRLQPDHRISWYDNISPDDAVTNAVPSEKEQDRIDSISYMFNCKPVEYHETGKLNSFTDPVTSRQKRALQVANISQYTEHSAQNLLDSLPLTNQETPQRHTQNGKSLAQTRKSLDIPLRLYRDSSRSPYAGNEPELEVIWTKQNENERKHKGLNGTIPLVTDTPKASMDVKVCAEFERECDDCQEQTPENLEKRRRHAEPFPYCVYVTRYPKTAFGLTLGGHILMMVIFGVLYMTGVNVMPYDFNHLPMNMTTSERLRWEAWKNRNDDPDIIKRWNSVDLQSKWPRMTPFDRFDIYYQLDSGNIFTKENLEKIANFEKKLESQSNYHRYCHLRNRNSDDCTKPVSVIQYFDGTYARLDDIYNDTGYNNIPQVIFAASGNPMLADMVDYHLTKDVILTNQTVYSDVTRSGFLLGFPLVNASDQSELDMLDEIDVFLNGNFRPKLMELSADLKPIKVLYASQRIFMYDLIPQAFKDMGLAVGSFVFIFAFIWIMTRSLWITSLAVFSVISSFVGTILIYTLILDFRYFGYFHIFSIYIILGIGADDFFVFYNTWIASGAHTYKSIAHRLSYTYRRAAKAMFFTSITTSVAFLANGLSPLLCINSFGIFSGILILVNYISVIVFFPTVVIIHDMYFKDITWKHICCSWRKKSTPADKHTTATMDRSTPTNNHSNTPSNNQSNAGNHQTTIAEDDPKGTTDAANTHRIHLDEPSSPKEYKETDILHNADTIETSKKTQTHRITKFFSGPYFRVVTHRIWRWVILACFVVVFGVLLYFATTIQIDSKQFKIYKDTTNYGQVDHLHYNVFKMDRNSVEYVDIYLIWGMKERDLSSCHHSDFHCIGEQRWDQSFDINQPRHQIAFKVLCDDLHNLTDDVTSKLHIRKDKDGRPEINCFITPMENYFNEQKSKIDSQKLQLPYKENNMANFMTRNSHIYKNNTSKLFNNYFEIGVNYWLSGGYSMTSPDYAIYNDLLGEMWNNPFTTMTKIKPQGNNTDFKGPYYGTRMQYIGVKIKTDIYRRHMGPNEGLKIMKDWDDYMEEKTLNLPNQLKHGFHTSEWWQDIKVLQRLTNDAMIGISAGITMSFPILLVATMNVILALLGTLVLAMITACTLAVIPLAGWKLGYNECYISTTGHSGPSNDHSVYIGSYTTGWLETWGIDLHESMSIGGPYN
ncbi:unnamed protein product [Owenia fusiformis]|uniref:Uncharacterized protein n=1 Tax=Owenia fusiformis TaxID=6347 RepID=A0A8J1YBF1_OWEFU|nr:unnamed protein product [Owenia fusiformis]